MQFLVDGKKVFAATGGGSGHGDLPTVIFLHGSGMDRTVWSLQTRWFAHHGRAVLAVDLPGHGASEGPPLPSIEALAKWVIGLMDAAKLEKAALVGHSLGALVALAAAAVAPTRIWALALLGAAARMPVHPDLLQAARDQDHKAIDLVAAWGFGRRAHFGGGQAPGLWMMGSGIRLLERAAAGVLANDLAACDAYHDALDAARKLRCPTRLICGAIDRMTGVSGGRELAAAIDGAQLVTIANAGHMMMVEQPDQTLAALREIV